MQKIPPAYQYSEEYALELDLNDPLKSFKEQFLFPTVDGKKSIYFCGNSLGLQPKSVKKYIQEDLDTWAQKGVDGHFTGQHPWIDVRNRSKPALAHLVGAHPHEVVAMNNLSSNLHFLMVSFYRPSATRNKILVESDAFPSDRYIMDSQVKFHGYDPEKTIIEVKPREGEHTLRTEDILRVIYENANDLALIMMSGVQYYTGQFFDLAAITEAGKKVGAQVGFDLAHAIGNVPLQLHDWEVDFAVWCSYKYLNSGPGNVGGIFVHEIHGSKPNLPRFSGWWGNQEQVRFKMEKTFYPMFGADGWQVSNNNVLALAAHQASLDIFDRAGINNLRLKSELLTGYLEFLIDLIGAESGVLKIISPTNSKDRGCQLSIRVNKGGKSVFAALYNQGVIGDWREPDVIRLAPTPLYNNFEEIFRFAKILEQSLIKFA
jgi:kynureninase